MENLYIPGIKGCV